MKQLLLFFLHCLFWSLLFYFGYQNYVVKVMSLKTGNQVEYFTKSNPAVAYFLLIDLLFKIGLFYGIIYNVISKYLINYHRKHLFHLLLLFIGTLGGSLLAYHLIVKTIFAYTPNKPSSMLSYVILAHLLILLIAVGYYLAKNWLITERNKKILQAEQLRTELAFLKTQINPHFLFNTLNNLFAEARRYEDKTLANGIAKLSHMMRYMIYDSNEPFVTIDKEIENIKSFIALQKLRTAPEDPIDIKFETKKLASGIKVAPIIFLPFVENAFKHGINPEETSFIHILLHQVDQVLLFQVTNSRSKHIKSVIQESGIGLDNIKRRLALIYPNHHHLEVRESTDTFKIVLKIALDENQMYNGG